MGKSNVEVIFLKSYLHLILAVFTCTRAKVYNNCVVTLLFQHSLLHCLDFTLTADMVSLMLQMFRGNKTTLKVTLPLTQ